MTGTLADILAESWADTSRASRATQGSCSRPSFTHLVSTLTRLRPLALLFRLHQEDDQGYLIDAEARETRYSSSTNSHTLSTPSFPPNFALAIPHSIPPPPATISTFSHSTLPSNPNASSFERTSPSSDGSCAAVEDSRVEGAADAAEPSPREERTAFSPEEEDDPAGIASSPSSFAPAERGAAPPPPPKVEEDAPDAASRRRSSSRTRDCFARSIVRAGDFDLADEGEEVAEEVAEVEEEGVSRSDLVRRTRTRGTVACRAERRERRERRTWKCLSRSGFRQKTAKEKGGKEV